MTEKFGTVYGKVTAEIVPAKLEDAVLDFETAVFRAEAIKPEVTVTDPTGASTEPLKEGQDYSVIYYNNFNPGTGMARIQGKGNFEGTILKPFQITKAPQDIRIGFEQTEIIFSKGSTFSLDAKAAGALSYSSGDSKTAEVDASGTVTMRKAGTVTIRVTAAQTKQYFETVKEVTFTFRELEKQKITAKGIKRVFVPGRKIQLTASALTPLSFKSLDETICTVDASGMLTMTGKGETKVRITAAASEVYAKAVREVRIRLTDKWEQELKVSKKAYRLAFKQGRTVTLKASAKTAVSFSSSDKSVAAVSKKGKITLKKPGIAFIHVTAKETGIYRAASVSVKVTVLPWRAAYRTVSSKAAGQLMLRWRMDDTVEGYELQIARDAGFTAGRMSARAKKDQSSTIVKGLASGTTIYARIRSYVVSGGETLYGSWSVVKSTVIR